jgi:excisionase family DNA binding protein
MNTLELQKIIPSEVDIVLARESSRALSAVLTSKSNVQTFNFLDDLGITHSVILPTSVLRLLLDLLAEIGQGNAVSIFPIHAELTTQEAADVLNVSHPYLVQLLEKEEIPYRKMGSHRRVCYQDVIEYKQRIVANRLAALNELTAQAQELNMGY